MFLYFFENMGGGWSYAFPCDITDRGGGLTDRKDEMRDPAIQFYQNQWR